MHQAKNDLCVHGCIKGSQLASLDRYAKERIKRVRDDFFRLFMLAHFLARLYIYLENRHQFAIFMADAKGRFDHRAWNLLYWQVQDDILPQRADWQELMVEATPVREQLAAILAGYTPGDKEAQAEHDFIRPVLQALGHSFEVQASLATPDGVKQPDYVFYRDASALNANKGKRLTEALLQASAFAVGDAK
jgi:hypothetical protein